MAAYVQKIREAGLLAAGVTNQGWQRASFRVGQGRQRASFRVGHVVYLPPSITMIYYCSHTAHFFHSNRPNLIYHYSDHVS
jgi:hypothetical protein